MKQTIGHRSLNSTSGYVSEMTDQERENRISSIKYGSNRSRINIHNLTTSNISDGIILYEKFNTNSFLSNKV